MTSLPAWIIAFTLEYVLAASPCRQPSAPDCTEPWLDSNDSDSLAGWEEYKQRFQKTYSSPWEEQHRKLIWMNNTLLIMKRNLDDDQWYSLGWTPFTDMTREEFEANLLGYMSPDNSSQVWRTAYLGQGGHVSVVTRVKNQGQCGSCWAFSVTGALEGAHAIANGIDAGKISMSEQQLLDCDTKQGGCSGGSPASAMDWEKGHNVCQERSYPYQGQRSSCRSNGCIAILNQGSIWGHYSVGQDEGSHCAALIQRPLSVVVYAKGVFMHYTGGILNGCQQAQTDHAILLVGYGYYKNKAYWKVKNSWGTTWGIGGFALLARGVGGTDSCAVLSGTNGVVVYGPYNPPSKIQGSDYKLIEDNAKMGSVNHSLVV